MDAWVWWLIGAVVLVGIEIATLDLIFAMLAGGALAGAAVAGIGLPPVLAVLAFVVVSVALLGTVRPAALSHLRQPLESRTGVAALVGSRALVLEQVDAHAGRVKLAGEVWSARAYDESQVIEAGASVDVIEIRGATALVYASEAPWKA